MKTYNYFKIWYKFIQFLSISEIKHKLNYCKPILIDIMLLISNQIKTNLLNEANQLW